MFNHSGEAGINQEKKVDVGWTSPKVKWKWTTDQPKWTTDQPEWTTDQRKWTTDNCPSIKKAPPNLGRGASEIDHVDLISNSRKINFLEKVRNAKSSTTTGKSG